MRSPKWIAAVLVLLTAERTCKGHLLDFGKCACSCRGDDGDAENAEPFSGPKGDVGAPGKQGPQGPPGAGADAKMGSAIKPGRTCSDILASGVNENGVYFIKPDDFSPPIRVYCDMETAGGAWTLVASVHENNPLGSCTAGDKWSSEQGNGKYPYSAGNWENTNTFGHALSASSDDYKSPAYFLTKAKNIMVWHVPNGTPASRYNVDATLKYRTRNNFLANHGDTLQSFYKDHYPVTKIEGETPFDINPLVHATRGMSGQITAEISNWNSYTYDDPAKQSIFDGGSDIFDGGNTLSFSVNEGEYQTITYEEKYAQSGVQLNTSTGYPFFMYLWIEEAVEQFRFKVDSALGADGEGSLATYVGSYILGDFTLAYTAQQVHGADDPSIMQAYFVISNPETWNSQTAAIEQETWATTTDPFNHVIRLGPVKNILFGYTLLSKRGARKISHPELLEVMKLFLQSVSATMPVYRPESCSRLNESLAVPVQYVRGDGVQVLATLPADLGTEVEPGFVHLRAAGKSGSPTAICSGFKSKSCSTDVLCAGGVQSGEEKLPCGDYPNWRGSRSSEALESSLLIFYDDQ